MDQAKNKINSEQAPKTKEDLVPQGIHTYSAPDRYVVPQDPLLQEQLAWWQDQKLGLMIHWGPYAQLGIKESWPMSDEDAVWSRKDIDWEDNGDSLRKQYFDLNKSFNPLRFQPDKWAQLAKEAGFRYLIFTTKHHDGFSMWDTKQTGYKSTGTDCPFHTHKYADICRHLFNAFRAEGLAIGAYFSKADWHNAAYWEPGKCETTRRGPSYDPLVESELWQKFVNFSREQILELLFHYGRIDILWLDAGWVSARNGQDIGLGEIVDQARLTQPWLISADRGVGGSYENYVTPEQTVPEQPLGIPWESCITLGTGFSYRYEDTYKSLQEVVLLLIDIVAKGGNLALNVGPQPDGRLPKGAVERLQGLGQWLQIYGEAIYGTRPCPPYREGPYAFTQKDRVIYCFYLDVTGDGSLDLTIPLSEEIRSIDLIDGPENLPYTCTESSIQVSVPVLNINSACPSVSVLRLHLA